MPRSRNVDSYSQDLLHLARAMYEGRITELRIGPMPLRDAQSRRQEWYAFVRAHAPSIDNANKRLQASLRMKDKHAGAKWFNRVQELDEQYTAIQQFECTLDHDITRPEDSAYVIFRSKTVRTVLIADALRAVGAERATIADIVAERNAGKTPAIFNQPKVDRKGNTLMAKGSLTERLEATKDQAPEFDYAQAGLSGFMPSQGEGFDLARVLSPEALAASPLPEPTRQLDSPAAEAYPSPVLPDSTAASPLSTTKEEPST